MGVVERERAYFSGAGDADHLHGDPASHAGLLPLQYADPAQRSRVPSGTVKTRPSASNSACP